MKHATMKTLYTLILLLFAGTSYGQTGQWVKTTPLGCKAFTLRDGFIDMEWNGGCKDDLVHGFGSLRLYVDKNLGYTAVGDYSQGKPNGQVTFIYSDGNKYVGEWKDGMFSGQGTYTYADGRKYIGEYKDGEKHGQGTFTWADGNKYFGEWVDGAFNGQGTYAFANGNKYFGEFKDGMPNGQGTYINADGGKYVGEFKDGEYNGQGTFTFADGDKYVGEFKDGKKHGQGTFTILSGAKYIGEYKDEKPDGQGTFTFADGDKYVGEFKDGEFDGQGYYTYADGSVWLGEWAEGKANGQLIQYTADNSIQESGIYVNNTLVTSQYIDPNSFTRIARNTTSPEVSDSQLQAIEEREKQVELEAQRVGEERRKLDEDKRQREQAKQASRISITASATQPDSNGVLTINIHTNSDTSSLKINGEELGGRVSGEYTVKKIARVGQETKFTIAGVDVNGNTDTKTITVSRTVVESKVTYPELNPSRIKSQPERDAVAIIIGISNYKSLPKADYAKDDAQVFFDYAIRALGVRPGNIKLLMDEQADAEEIYTAFKTWLPARVKSTTDVYVFYSGHGLPTQDGSGLYWLPQRANRDLLSKTAILLQEINSDIQASKPKSVTIFMDACYSGQARGGETLVASARPIALKSQPTTFPSNFTVISASQADQISSSSPELQHGIFSYYLMRGMEGEADLNKDGKITLDEIQAYLSENVGRQARIMNRQQEPQVIGDGARVLVGR